MLRCLCKDPIMWVINVRDYYWAFTLLDPRWKGKMVDLMPPSKRMAKVQHFKEVLHNIPFSYGGIL